MDRSTEKQQELPSVSEGERRNFTITLTPDTIQILKEIRTETGETFCSIVRCAIREFRERRASKVSDTQITELLQRMAEWGEQNRDMKDGVEVKA
jgi:hypothetical protein